MTSFMKKILKKRQKALLEQIQSHILIFSSEVLT
jgi:hypothetical protein